MEIRPLPISKANTAVQIILAGAILGFKAFGISNAPWLEVMVLLVATLTIASMTAYLAQWLKHMSA